MNKAPAFQFYPDKWDSHTRHLSDRAYRIYHQMICWMWQHAKDYSSMPNDPKAVATALAMPLSKVTKALEEIQGDTIKLLRETRTRYVSDGLRKEVRKQQEWREKSSAGGRASAKARKRKGVTGQGCLKGGGQMVGTNGQPKGQPNGNTPSPFPSPSPSLKKETVSSSLLMEVTALVGTLAAKDCPDSEMAIERHIKGALSHGVDRNAIREAINEAKAGLHVWDVLNPLRDEAAQQIDWSGMQ